MNGSERIAAERRRQIEVEGHTLEHDADHDDTSLIMAAVSYAFTAAHGNSNTLPDPLWPWEVESWKPSDNPVRNLEKAGALIAAEIDRLDDDTEDTDG